MILDGANFTSALFLAQRHLGFALPLQEPLTTGVPAAIEESHAARLLASTIASLQGAEAGITSRSALHALIDVMETLPKPGELVLVDESAYPLSHWACWAATARGVRVQQYPHHRPPMHLSSRRTWFVTDGWCQGCNLPAPLVKMQKAVQENNGRVIVDDSLAFGVLGRRAYKETFGDGTGTVRWSGLNHANFIWIASLAKAYGSPVAVITADHANVARVIDYGSNRVHSSPPSSADVHAGLNAVLEEHINRQLRKRLYESTCDLRRDFRSLGLSPLGLPFPITGTRVRSLSLARRLYEALIRKGIAALVQIPRCSRYPLLSVIIRSDHQHEDLNHLSVTLADIFRNERLT